METKEDSDNSRLGFKELMSKRYSAREYAEGAVDMKRIEDSIETSMKTPSVCNRQPTRVFVITDKEKIKETMAIQGGFNGYKIPPVLLAVTSDLSSFVSIEEVNEPYVDGGLFSMSLMLSLQSNNLAVCPLNAMMTNKKKEQIRKIDGIPASHDLIMFLAVGNRKEINVHPKSYRKGGYEITSKE